MQTLDDIVWAIQPEKDRLDHFASYLSQCAFEFLTKTGIAAHLEIPDQLPHWPMSARTRHNLLLAAKEAMTNIAKHAQAEQVILRLMAEEQSFTIEIRDNGKGFVPTAAPGVRSDQNEGFDSSTTPRAFPSSAQSSRGATSVLHGSTGVSEPPIALSSARAGRNGLANMRSRIESVGGRFELQTEPGQGTTIRFRIPKKGI